MTARQYCVYIMTNKHNTVLYTGVTNDLQRRVQEHRSRGTPGFTKRYNLAKLVFFQCGPDIHTALAREKKIKGGSRRDKLALIESINPTWKDLYTELFDRAET